MRDKLIAKLDKALQKDGYDSILDEENGAVAVFDSNQIKSVDNQGTFSREDNNIYKQAYGERAKAREKLKRDIAEWKAFIEVLPRKVWHKNSKQYKKLIHVIDTPLVLQICGIPNLPMSIKQGKINQIRVVDHPEITDEIMAQVPGAMTDPIAVVKSASRPESSIIELLSLKDAKGINVIVPIELNLERNGIDINLIATAYGKGDNKVNVAWYNRVFSDFQNVLYLNEKKTQALASLGVQFSLRDTNGLSLFDTPTILHEDDLVKSKLENPQLYQDNAQVKGSFNPTMQDGQYAISLFKVANASTVIHETSHYFCITFNVCFFTHASVFKILILVYNTRKLSMLVLRLK